MPQSNMSDRADVRAAQAVLSEANHAHGTQFKLNHRFDDGVQSGAWLLLDDNGRRAVLKWSPVRDWARQIERAAGGIAKIRAAGYPTPAWLAVGTNTDGFGYQIQDFVPGRSPNQVTTSEAQLLIGILETHAGLDPDPQRCWSQFVTTCMTDRRDDLLQQTAETGPTGQNLVNACERLLAAHGPVTLPTGDLVHGDFRPGNILFHADRVSGVIDIEALGSGTRVFDYATLLSAHDITPEAVQMLCAAGEQVAGPGALAYCFAQVALDLAVFVHRRNLRPGIQNVSKLLDRVVILLNRTDGV
ncbi:MULTISPECIES: aminoglycoside phosphotransferase family protein [unclassified Streptomyces]|uniref:aminoglycoside phosphotransferase family protein n=1 Tax=unclassified Streptomyces TaxID=2593676 RepID=UPI002DDC6EF0|nr:MULTISPECIES: aminoglycoside phosphotransferase family protein [unclassified Streptomyces]WSC34188.1 aminoglycoside phosphotransferase family protein [Streptomyces sp. NBC_01763]WSC41870.1 aminoglycoside phosphotransferase family protein [Streptomyces sp. NBC_01763]